MSDENNATVVVVSRFRLAEIAALRQLQERLGLNASDTVRHCIGVVAHEHNIQFPKRERKAA